MSLRREGVAVVACSRWWSSAPVPPSGQGRYVNGVARVETSQTPLDLLRTLHRIEDRFGRARGVPNAARTLDLDLIDYDGQVRSEGEVILPHPRLSERAFVLLPLAEVAPGWVHPVTGKTLRELIAELPEQDCQLI